ncbi:glycoside hydrolase [bacterium]|nr:glycoside hydrolase [bacterium]
MLTKRYLKTKPVCKVTFAVKPEEHPNASEIHLVGEFNAWNTKAQPMKKNKEGKFSATLDLPTGATYQFRYLIDGRIWENDWSADDYVPNNLTFDENSVVAV